MGGRRAALIVHRLVTTPDGVQIQKDATYPKVLTFQYTPESLKRSIQTESQNAEGETLRMPGPPVVTFELTAELLAWDQDASGARAAAATEFGVRHQVAALEALLYPTHAAMERQRQLADQGRIEVVPEEEHLVLLVWSKDQVCPVQLTSLSVTEDRFDADLRPVHATAELSFRMLTVNDLGFSHPGSRVASQYHQRLEAVAARGAFGSLQSLGLTPAQLGMV